MSVIKGSEVKPTDILAPYRVLDLTDERGYFCGKILGDLGADVIKIEKPGGDPGRNLGPFYKDVPDPEKSLFWFAYNANKRGITLNIETTQGKEIFKRLVEKADIVVENFAPGYLDGLGLGYEVLSKINPRLIMTSVTLFGQAGPYRDFRSSDLVNCALGGLMFSNGDSDRPPVRTTFPQTFNMAAAEAAVGSLMALLYRHAIGEGQLVEVQTQRAVASNTYDVEPWWYGNKEIRKRQGSTRRQAGGRVVAKQMWQCKDGFMSYFAFGGIVGASGNKALIAWMDREGFADDFVRRIDWVNLDWSKIDQDFVDKFQGPISRFFMAHTKVELLDGSLKSGIQIYPVNAARDIVNSRQLEARKYWAKVEHPELGSDITYPGPFARFSELPMSVRFRAPTIGEHNEDIYAGELGFSREDMVTLKQTGVI